MSSPIVKKTELYHKNIIDLIDKVFSPVLQQLDSLRDLIENRKFSFNFEEENVIIELFSQYDITDVGSLLKIDNFRKELQIVIRTLNPQITWIPETKENTIYSYHIGNSPWSLTLVAENWKNAIIATQNDIMDMYKKGEIEKLQGDGAIGDSILFLKNGKIHRGLITSVEEESFGIINIDNGHTMFCEKEMIFAPTLDIQSNPAQSIHCSVINSMEFDESIWCTVLENIFKSVLVENKLRLAKWSKDSSVPPKFTVRLIGINDLHEEVDLTKWLEEDILRPWKLEGLPSGKSATKFFGPRYKDPFKTHTTKLSHAKLLNQTIYSTSPVKTNIESQLAIKCKAEIDTGGTVTRIQEDFEEKRLTSEEDSVFRMDLKAMETAANTELELEYQSKDDKLMCRQYKMFNYCLKKNCDRLHKKPPIGKWTDDKNKVHINPFNSLELPACGEIVVIQVLEMVNGCSFFGMLPNYYFDEYGRELTIREEMKRINEPAVIRSYKCLPTDPRIGEIVLAYCSDKIFYRARVIELTVKGFLVFQVDFGKTENICFENLKKIDLKFLHYPFQAIRFKLGGSSCKNEKKAKEYINGMIGHCFEALILPSQQEEEALNVKVFIGDFETTLNELIME